MHVCVFGILREGKVKIESDDVCTSSHHTFLTLTLVQLDILLYVESRTFTKLYCFIMCSPHVLGRFLAGAPLSIEERQDLEEAKLFVQANSKSCRIKHPEFASVSCKGYAWYT